MITRLRRVLERKRKTPDARVLRFDRPLMLLQSDDWGRVGVRDQEGWSELRACGLNLGEKPYDYYTLETTDDLQALSEVLRRHVDSVGRQPCLGMNFVTANVDFPRCRETKLQEIPMRPLSNGLPEPWQRPGLLESYREGIREHLFAPALHGFTHFCAAAVARESQTNSERHQLLEKLWGAGTPYIHWRMPWIGYEYWDPSVPPERSFLSLTDQHSAIQRAAEIFRGLFSEVPVSACAPGYRANRDTETAWFDAGVRVAQEGPGGRKEPFLDAKEMLHTFRTVELEPATQACDLRETVKRANDCLARGVPAIISIHSINFHSTIRDFRTPTLALLDGFLTAMERKWPNLLYVRDAELWQIAMQGFLAVGDNNVAVGVTAA